MMSVAAMYNVAVCEYLEYLAGGAVEIGIMIDGFDEAETAAFMSKICAVCFAHDKSTMFAALVIFGSFLEKQKNIVSMKVKH